MAISTTQLAVMQTTRQSHLMDTCVHEVYSSTTAAHGEPVANYSDGSTYACGIEMDPGKELQIGADTVKHNNVWSNYKKVSGKLRVRLV